MLPFTKVCHLSHFAQSCYGHSIISQHTALFQVALRTKGFKGRPICGPGTISRHSNDFKKCVYNDQHQKWLSLNHPFRQSTPFNGHREVGAPPSRLTTKKTLHYENMQESFVANGASPTRDDHTCVYGINRVLVLFKLPYWHVSFLNPICLCVLHSS